jgi:hypothetical protein
MHNAETTVAGLHGDSVVGGVARPGEMVRSRWKKLALNDAPARCLTGRGKSSPGK